MFLFEDTIYKHLFVCPRIGMWYNQYVMFKEEFIKRLRGLDVLKKDDTLIVGFSGGADSTCLLQMLIAFNRTEKLQLNIVPVHVNHMIRGDDANQDEDFCKEFCEIRSLKLVSIRRDCPAYSKARGLSLEEAGREIRYEAFKSIAQDNAKAGEKKGRKPFVVVAHNRDDQMETILLHIIRGTGLDGLSGMTHVAEKEDYILLRPLLDFSKKEITEYCKRKNIEYREDLTNQEDIYTRNSIRLRLMPLLREYNPKIEDSLERLSKVSRQTNSYMQNQVDKAYEKFLEKEDGGEIVLKGGILSEDPVIFNGILRKALGSLGLIEGLYMSHIEVAKKALSSENPSARCSLPKGYGVARTYDRIRIYKEGDKQLVNPVNGEIGDKACESSLAKLNNILERGLLPKGMIQILDREQFIKLDRPKNSYLAFDLDRLGEILGELGIDTRKEGMYLLLKDGHRKKLKKLLIDEKIPRHMRDELVFLTKGSLVLGFWYGERLYVSQVAMVMPSTKRVLYIEKSQDLW